MYIHARNAIWKSFESGIQLRRIKCDTLPRDTLSSRDVRKIGAEEEVSISELSFQPVLPYVRAASVLSCLQLLLLINCFYVHSYRFIDYAHLADDE